MRPRVVSLSGLIGVSLLIAAPPTPGAAQDRIHTRWEIPGFDFRKDGVWRVRARAIAATRRALLGQGRMAELNAPIARGGQGPASTAVTGSLGVPFILISYQGIDSVTAMRNPADYDALLFGATAPSGLPYSLNSFYRQMSNDMFGMSGTVSAWARLSQAEVNYTGTPSSTCALQNPFGTNNCNGLFSSTAIAQMQNGLREALAAVDGAINFALFDNDGPDGIPNSSDDDGFVDLVLFGHATQDGACGGSTNNHIWSHRYALVTGSGSFVTNDPSAAGGTIRVSDYLIQSALGGATGCDVNTIMPIGTVAHELGHGIGLPDLYDVNGNIFGPSVGIGQWGLMGTGNFSSPRSPSRMESWSLNELGWIALDTLTTSGTYALGEVPVADTALVVRVQGANPRGEYFLIENRQASQADTAMIRLHCARSGNPIGCGGGLVIWHVDSTKVASGRLGNSVNNGPIHGLALMQADGFRNLEANEVSGNICASGGIVNGCSDRGDAGDPYPGTAGNTVFSFRTNPAARKNSDGSFIGFAVDQITQVTPVSTMSFRLRFGALSVVRASDTAAVIQFEGVNFTVFRDLLEEGGSYDISVADTQVAANGRTRWRFDSWSDLGARTHTITGQVLGDTIVATLTRDFRLVATAAGPGTIQPDTAVDLAGTFIPEGRAVTLTATPDAGQTFGAWSGDTTSTDSIITLPMGRPYTVSACFGVLSITTVAARDGVMGAPYADTLRAGCGGGGSWAVSGGALPDGVTLATTGVVSGFPRESGTFSYDATVTVGGASDTKTFTFSVTAPALATADVVAHLLGPSAPLTADQIRYLDFLGNNNTVFDIGDFLAWVKGTGAP
ncbi:MAG: M6 family metalloprotease domain-containing protein [Gemmatimonadales bacterium]|nr:M6 family metalloprotease domain-containing protein [Gemmatimonadales bacterium]